jgi:hypothetical protein
MEYLSESLSESHKTSLSESSNESQINSLRGSLTISLSEALHEFQAENRRVCRRGSLAKLSNSAMREGFIESIIAESSIQRTLSGFMPSVFASCFAAISARERSAGSVLVARRIYFSWYCRILSSCSFVSSVITMFWFLLAIRRSDLV